jgi:hypothetical protein
VASGAHRRVFFSDADCELYRNLLHEARTVFRDAESMPEPPSSADANS